MWCAAAALSPSLHTWQRPAAPLLLLVLSCHNADWRIFLPGSVATVVDDKLSTVHTRDKIENVLENIISSSHLMCSVSRKVFWRSLAAVDWRELRWGEERRGEVCCYWRWRNVAQRHRPGDTTTMISAAGIFNFFYNSLLVMFISAHLLVGGAVSINSLLFVFWAGVACNIPRRCWCTWSSSSISNVTWPSCC